MSFSTTYYPHSIYHNHVNQSHNNHLLNQIESIIPNLFSPVFLVK